MDTERKTHPIKIGEVKRDLPLFEVAPGVIIAILNILGDVELTQAASSELAEKLGGLEYDVLVTAEAKSIPLIYQLAIDTGKSYVVLRKTHKPYMGKVVVSESESITTGKIQQLFLDEKDAKLIRGKKVAVVDDVISTSSTVDAIKEVVRKAGGEVVGEAAIFTEGDPESHEGRIALGSLPVWIENRIP